MIRYMKKKKKITQEQKRAFFYPLNKYEDKKRAEWFLLGAGTVMLVYFLSLI